MIGQKIVYFLEKYPYEGRNRTIAHCAFWVVWFVFIWFYTPNNFLERDYNFNYFLFLSVRDVGLVIFCFYFTEKMVFKTISEGQIIIPVLSLLFTYFLIYCFTYVTFNYIQPLLFPYLPVKTYSSYFLKNTFWQGLIMRRTFWHTTFWYALYFAIPIMIKLMVDIFSFRLKNAQLEKANIRLELDYLKAQVNPHFLFNTLNSIYSIVVDSEPKAAQIILKLSDLMRYSLYEANNDQVALSREIQFIRDYVELEQIRHKRNVSIECEIYGDTDNLEIPPLLLITFVENAFKHGINNNIKASWIKIKIEISGKNLSFSVGNSKPLKLQKEKIQGGIGMWNVRKRLDMLYAEVYDLDIKNEPESFWVLLKVQLR